MEESKISKDIPANSYLLVDLIESSENDEKVENVNTLLKGGTSEISNSSDQTSLNVPVSAEDHSVSVLNSYLRLLKVIAFKTQMQAQLCVMLPLALKSTLHT